MASLWDGPVDLLLGGRCVGCARGGAAVCPPCLETLPLCATPAWPSPPPAGLAPPYALTEYAGLARAMVLAHKERGVLELGPPLGRSLAISVATAVSEGVDHRRPAMPHGLLLVPVPSRAASVRARGHDPMLSIARHAARSLTRAGWRASCAPVLRAGQGLSDQSGLDAAERARNVRGSMRVSQRSIRSFARKERAEDLLATVVCDDVLTTGATAREAQRALEEAGLTVVAIATVSATRRRG